MSPRHPHIPRQTGTWEADQRDRLGTQPTARRLATIPRPRLPLHLPTDDVADDRRPESPR